MPGVRKVGIVICNRYGSCGGGKCFRALKERKGGFSLYDPGEPVEIVGFANCGGCPGGNVEYVPAEFMKNGCDVVHLATGMVVGYPPCPRIREFKDFIELRYGVPVVVGTHPIPMKYMEFHSRLPFWERSGMRELAGRLMEEPRDVMEAYD